MKRLIIIAAIAAISFLSDSFAVHAQSRTGVVTASSMVVTRTKVRNPIKVQWQDKFEFTYTEHYQVSYTGGWRFGNFLFLGFGAGVQVYPNVIPWDENGTYSIKFPKNENPNDVLDDSKYYSTSKIAVPIYAQIRFRFLKTAVSPYLSGSGGWLFQNNFLFTEGREHDPELGECRLYSYETNDMNGCYYAEVFVGADVRLKNGAGVSLGLGPIWTGQDGHYLNPRENDTRAIGGFKLELSF